MFPADEKTQQVYIKQFAHRACAFNPNVPIQKLHVRHCRYHHSGPTENNERAVFFRSSANISQNVTLPWLARSKLKGVLAEQTGFVKGHKHTGSPLGTGCPRVNAFMAHSCLLRRC